MCTYTSRKVRYGHACNPQYPRVSKVHSSPQICNPATRFAYRPITTSSDHEDSYVRICVIIFWSEYIDACTSFTEIRVKYVVSRMVCEKDPSLNIACSLSQEPPEAIAWSISLKSNEISSENEFHSGFKWFFGSSEIAFRSKPPVFFENLMKIQDTPDVYHSWRYVNDAT